jgi:hypothetical protein
MDGIEIVGVADGRYKEFIDNKTSKRMGKQIIKKESYTFKYFLSYSIWEN